MRPRILILGDPGDARDEVHKAFERSGFTDLLTAADPTGDGSRPAPDLVVAVGGAAACERARAAFDEVPILAVADALPAGAEPPEHGTAALQGGADDVVRRPFEGPVLATRARRLITAAQTQRKAQHLARLHDVMLEILSLGAGGDSAEGLHRGLCLAAEVMRFDRAWLIAHLGGKDSAYVVATTGDPTLVPFAIRVAAYPALRAAMDSGHPVLVDDVRETLAAPAGEGRIDRDVRGLAVFPLLWRGEVRGVVLFGRRQAGVAHVDPHRRAFATLFAEHTAVRLEHGPVLAQLREQTQRLSRARYEAERRLRTLDSLRDYFEAAADGVLVIDGDGHILFVNRAAEQITGFAGADLVGSPIEHLVPGSEHEHVRRAVADVLTGHNVRAFELHLHTTSDEDLCVSVTTSTVLSERGAAILTFRDITAQRALEGELRKTKDFLERLIDSAVDAIVAADMRGSILIFNKGAERIFGYSAEEVIGRIPVWKLYAEGVPQQVMRMLRSTQYGGVGRIDQIRREIVNKRGERVPVNMTASMIYEEGRSVATVGIFSDLRDRIRIEQRLLQAQEKLEVTEQQAMLAQLAGTAAHELNQPLTSIQACAEMIQRLSDPDAPHMRHLQSIADQTERMATIVRKIGRITRYETKQYLPGTLIVDLDKSSAEPTPERAQGGGGDFGNGYDAQELEPDFADEFEDEHQITIARVELDEVMPDTEEETLVKSSATQAASDSEESAP